MEELDEILDNPRNHTLVVYEVVMGIQEKFKLIKNQINRWGGKRYVVLGVGFELFKIDRSDFGNTDGGVPVW